MLSHQFKIKLFSLYQYMKLKIQRGIYSSPALETASPVVIFVNHLEYTDEKVINQSWSVLLTAEVFSMLLEN